MIKVIEVTVWVESLGDAWEGTGYYPYPDKKGGESELGKKIGDAIVAFLAKLDQPKYDTMELFIGPYLVEDANTIRRICAWIGAHADKGDYSLAWQRLNLPRTSKGVQRV